MDDIQEIERSFVQFMISHQEGNDENRSQQDENEIPNESKNLDYTQNSQGSQEATEETLIIQRQLNLSNNLPLSEESEGLDEFDNFVEPNVTNYNPGLGTSSATSQNTFLNDSISSLFAFGQEDRQKGRFQENLDFNKISRFQQDLFNKIQQKSLKDCH